MVTDRAAVENGRSCSERKERVRLVLDDR